MPICLQCGTHAESVSLLWTEATGRDERYCFACERRYRLTHLDCTPKGQVIDGGKLLLGAKEPTNMKAYLFCELCGNTTIVKELTHGKLLCFSCQARVNELAVKDGKLFVAGERGLILVPSKERAKKWCCKCCNFKPEKGGMVINGTKYAWMCEGCLDAENEGDKVDWHVKLQVKGKEETLHFFHWMMNKLDADYTGGTEFMNEAADLCPICGGWEWKNPRMKPHQIKKLGKLAGLRKIKVLFWGKAGNCNEKQIEMMVRNAKYEKVMV